ncbi:MAG: arsenite methyltransferase [Candidatus Omnitrophota bacterium]
MKDFVKKIYGAIAKKKDRSCCGPTCCSSDNPSVSEKVGYTVEELKAIPEDANMGLGCGNPVAIASIKKGETVVDLGSGGGIDVFLAAKRVGDKGRAIGIDMTEEMVKKAKANAEKAGYNNVEFRLGDIENIPLEDSVADCVISNCVINLAEDKQKVFNEAFRILKPKGRLMVSDMVLLGDLTEEVKRSAHMYAGCISGALRREEYIDKILRAGFEDVQVVKEDPVCISDYIGSDKVISDIAKDMSKEEIEKIDKAVVSIKIRAVK